MKNLQGIIIDIFLIVLVFLGIPHLFVLWNVFILLLVLVTVVYMGWLLINVNTMDLETKQKARDVIIKEFNRVKTHPNYIKILSVFLLTGSVFFITNPLVNSLIILRVLITVFEANLVNWFTKIIDI